MEQLQVAKPTRRDILQGIAVAGCLATGCLVTRGKPVFAADSNIQDFLMRLRKPDGGFGWSDQPRSHLMATFAVVGCCNTMQIELTDTEPLAKFVREHHPADWKPDKQHYREFDLQQIQTLKWLGQDVSGFKEKVALWTAPIPYASQYERHAYPIFRKQIATLLCRDELGLPREDLKAPLQAYLDQRRRTNGSFNNTPSDDGSDGHVVATWWGLEALKVLGRNNDFRGPLVAWLQACQQSDGGFTWQPRPSMSALSTATYTRAALLALELLDAKALDETAVKSFILSLKNSDHGFAERPGWLSNPMSTYYAIDALACLTMLSQVDQPLLQLNQTTSVSKQEPLPENLQVYSAQIQSHGIGSPREAVLLAQRLGISLWGAKNSTDDWIATAQRIADQTRVPVKFFVANEDYATWIHQPGQGTYSHMSDIIAESLDEAAGALAGNKAVTWPEYRRDRLQPLEKAGGRLIWQFGENEDLVRLLLDDSVSRGGFAAISTFHFGNADFTDTEPFLHLYRGQIPYVALQDAHGKQPWWFADMTTGFRTLFLAEEPSWEGLLTALKYNWTVAVRHDTRTDDQLIMHAASEQVEKYVLERREQWRWWGTEKNSRPLVSLQAIGPDELYETGCPQSGMAVRIRCAWTNSTQGRPLEPLSKLLSLSVDGRVVVPSEIRDKSQKGNLEDIYELYEMPDAVRGQHRVEACVQNLSTGEQIVESITF